MSSTELEHTTTPAQCEKKAEVEPGQDAKPPCPSTDPPSILGQGMDFQREPEYMHLFKRSYPVLGAHPLCLFPPDIK